MLFFFFFFIVLFVLQHVLSGEPVFLMRCGAKQQRKEPSARFGIKTYFNLNIKAKADLVD